MDNYVYRFKENTAIEFLNTQKFQDAEQYHKARKITHFDFDTPLLGKVVKKIILRRIQDISLEKCGTFLINDMNMYGEVINYSLLDKIGNHYIHASDPRICLFKAITAFLGEYPNDIDYIKQNRSILGKQYILIFILKNQK